MQKRQINRTSFDGLIDSIRFTGDDGNQRFARYLYSCTLAVGEGRPPFDTILEEPSQTACLTQAAMNKQFNIPLPTISKWENGKTKPPKYLVNLIAWKLNHLDQS